MTLATATRRTAPPHDWSNSKNVLGRRAFTFDICVSMPENLWKWLNTSFVRFPVLVHSRVLIGGKFAPDFVIQSLQPKKLLKNWSPFSRSIPKGNNPRFLQTGLLSSSTKSFPCKLRDPEGAKERSSSELFGTGPCRISFKCTMPLCTRSCRKSCDKFLSQKLVGPRIQIEGAGKGMLGRFTSTQIF